LLLRHAIADGSNHVREAQRILVYFPTGSQAAVWILLLQRKETDPNIGYS
jgi:phytoene/squalene synthetase